MPRFRYVSLDDQGRERRGWIDSPDAPTATLQLRERGISAHEVVLDSPQQSATPSTSAQAKSVRSIRPTTQGEQFLLFSQLSSLFRAGHTPSKVMEMLADRSRDPGRRETFLEIARELESGSGIGDALQKYPDLFPLGTVGAVRAGETGGYLPEACASIAEAAQRADKARRMFYYVAVFVLNTILLFPVVFIMIQAMDAGIATINTDGNVARGYLDGFKRGATYFGIAWLALSIGLSAYAWWWSNQTKSRKFRHRFVTKAPVISKRSKGDSLAHFSWHLSKLSEAGLSPIRSFQLASEAVPNEHYRALLMREATRVKEGESLSAAMRRTGVFPDEFWALVETGETTGQLPMALRDIQGLSLDQVKEAEGHLKWRTWGWVFILYVLGTCLGGGWFIRAYMDSMFKHILGE